MACNNLLSYIKNSVESNKIVIKKWKQNWQLAKHFYFTIKHSLILQYYNLKDNKKFKECPITFFVLFLFRNSLIIISLFNPLTAKDKISFSKNLTFLWSWILRWKPRSAATHAPLCNTLSSNKLSKYSENSCQVKGLMVFHGSLI